MEGTIPRVSIWNLGDDDVICHRRFINCNKLNTLVGMLYMVEVKSLYLLPQLCCEPKSALKNIYLLFLFLFLGVTG